MLAPEELQALCARCDETGVQFISDELYHGIVYEGAPRAASALEFTRHAIVINGFSKAYSMTGVGVGSRLGLGLALALAVGLGSELG